MRIAQYEFRGLRRYRGTKTVGQRVISVFQKQTEQKVRKTRGRADRSRARFRFLRQLKTGNEYRR